VEERPVAIPIHEIGLVPTIPSFLRVFTHTRCQRPILSADGTTRILDRGNDRLYCGNCQLNLDEEAAWAVRSAANGEFSRGRMMAHDFEALKRHIADGVMEAVDDGRADPLEAEPAPRRPRSNRRRGRRRGRARSRPHHPRVA
jgi:hypothetical protein